jgi:hypothetical protein
MVIWIDATEQPDLAEVVQRETGIKLKKRGRLLFGKCPFHNDSNPSFVIYYDQNTYHCFGCHKHGDTIRFIMEIKKMSSKDACLYLGINIGKIMSEEEQLKMAKHKEKKAKREVFAYWVNEYHTELCKRYRKINEIKLLVKSDKQLEKVAKYYHELSQIEEHLEILEGNDNKLKTMLHQHYHTAQ